MLKRNLFIMGSLTSTNPSFSGLLTNVKNTNGVPFGPEQFEQIKDKIKIKPATHFLLPPESYIKGATPPPPKEGHVRICCVSDTHTAHDALTDFLPKNADILIHAGDFTDVGKPRDYESFCRWLTEIRPRFKHVLVTSGNHDLMSDEKWYEKGNWKRFGHEEKYDCSAIKALLKNSCTYVEHDSVEVMGLKFFLSPYSPWFHDWAFNLDRKDECHNAWKQIPTDTDVLVTHTPALGHGDQCVPDMKHYGDADLLDWCEMYKPKLHVSGHLHESYGATTNGSTVFLNASSLNVMYDQTKPNMPMVIDVAVGGKEKGTTTKKVEADE